MYRHRTRPKYSDEDLAELYKHRYNHERWPDHIARVEKTIEVGLALLGDTHHVTMADLSCGDAAVAVGIANEFDKCCIYYQLGDITPVHQFTGPIEETIDQINGVDLFICSETIEHLDDPDAVLAKIRQKSGRLLLSTPNCSWPDPNPEHYWSWDKEAVEQMLRQTGWNPIRYDESYTGLGYRYQIWSCE